MKMMIMRRMRIIMTEQVRRWKMRIMVISVLVLVMIMSTLMIIMITMKGAVRK